MNFLAHIYLSEGLPELTIGNFIADAVKGKKFKQYPPQIQHGILLHRKIDFYTDTHPIVQKSMRRLFPKYRHYSGVIVDIFYDHFLAANWSHYATTPLATYISDFYALLEEYHAILPQKIQHFVPHMIKDNWLLSYTTVAGIGNILYQMNRRTQERSQMNLAVVELETYYSEFEYEFHSFFKELKAFTKNEIRSLSLPYFT